MQKNYKHYTIKSTANNKRYKLYNKDEPNVEIFMSPYLSDVMAFISIEENELYIAEDLPKMHDGLVARQRELERDPVIQSLMGGPSRELADANFSDTPVALLTHPETGEQILAPIEQLSLADDTGFKSKPIIKKKPIVKKKTSMKMKKK